MSEVKRTLREDNIARSTRLVRDRAYRKYGAWSNEYAAIVEALAQVRAEYR